MPREPTRHLKQITRLWPDWAALAALFGVLAMAWGGFTVAVSQDWRFAVLSFAGLLALTGLPSQRAGTRTGASN
jgi:hypothetical protein